MPAYVSDLESTVIQVLISEWKRMEAMPEGPARALVLNEIRELGVFKNRLELYRLKEEYDAHVRQS